MKIKVETKWGVGDTVKIKGATQRFLINNIIAEICPGGIQILYKGIILFPKDSFRIKDSRVEWLFDKELCLNENLLEGLDKENFK